MPGLRQAAGTMSPTRSFWKSLRYFALGRVVLATVLVLLGTLENFGLFTGIPDARNRFAAVALIYFLLGSGLLLVSLVPRRFDFQLALQVGCDLIALVLLMNAAGGARSGVGVLMVAAVAGASVLCTRRMAAAFAASAALLLLAEAVWRLLTVDPQDFDGLLPPASIGVACFLTAELVNRLALRLASQEALALARGRDLQRQLAVTQLVMTQLPQGVVVFDAKGRVLTMNLSARAMLGDAGPWPGLERLAAELLQARRASGPDAHSDASGAGDAERLVDAAEIVAGLDRVIGRAAADVSGAEQGLQGTAAPEAGGRTVGARLLVRMLRTEQIDDGDAVMVLEDQRALEDRAQQLKLASMGRLSASIAHEIRNPLSAIRHANALLAEQLSAAPMVRLASIVEDNTVRIDRIIRDVLSVARREPPVRQSIDMATLFAELLPELRAMALEHPERVCAEVTAPEPLLFDPAQLRQVIVNLVGNALRHASQAPGAVRLQWRRGRGDRLELRVCDDGPGLPADMTEQVFEPFFTTGTQGTGLGLYLAREICAGNGAVLRYDAGASDVRGGVFLVLPRDSAERSGGRP